MTADLVAAGETPERARAQARRSLGNLTLIHQQARESYWWSPLASGLDDLQHAWRRLRAAPAAAAVAVAMLAVAVGLSASMFAVVDALLVRPAPFTDPATFVRIGFAAGDGSVQFNVSLPVIRVWRETAGFSAVHAVMQEPASFDSGDDAMIEPGARVTPGLFEDLGAQPLLGRLFAPDEGGPGRDQVVILAESTWRARFAADAAIVGRRISLSGVPTTVVGVMPQSFAFPFGRTRVWRPLDLDRPSGRAAGPGVLAYAYARLAGDVPRDDAARLAGMAARSVEPQEAAGGVQLQPLEASLDRYSVAIVKVMATGVVLVFFVLCANAMSVALTRLTARRREFAVCSVLGASRGRLLHQAACEQLLIGVAATALGLGLGMVGVALAREYLPEDLVARTLNPLDLDWRAVLAASCAGLLALLVAGLVPAWIGTGRRVSSQLQTASKGATGDRHAQRVTAALLVGQLALAVALCVGAGIQARSFTRLLQIDHGLDAARLVSFDLTFPAAIADGIGRMTAAERLRLAAERHAGVERATVSYGVPPSGGSLYMHDVVADVEKASPVRIDMHGFSVTPDFFRVLGIRLLAGRTFEPHDPRDTAVISQSLGRTLWPDRQAVGRALTFSGRTLRVVGVAADVRNPLQDPRADNPEIYEPLLTVAHGDTRPSLTAGSVSLVVRCRASCPPLDALRRVLKAADPALGVRPGHRVDADYATALERPRTGTIIALTFATVALLAVGAGLFALLMRAALERQREFGIRLALGASPADLSRLVRRRSLAITTAGLACGLALAWVLGRVLASVQHAVTLADPLTWAVVIAVLAATALLAAWRPARFARQTDPAIMLRAD